jgi:hypothetical protein
MSKMMAGWKSWAAATPAQPITAAPNPIVAVTIRM